MDFDEKYIKRCIDIAYSGLGRTFPNPMVGAVIVHEDKIIGEGYHCRYGCPHAEVNAINSVKNKDLLKSSVLYVNLEPCCHYGKTPPCTEMILKYQIPRIVIGSADTSKKINGRGVRTLKDAGCDVTIGKLELECRDLNRFFYTYHEKQRPYIILKWAQTIDGFIDSIRKPGSVSQPENITDDISQILVHKWRAESQSILAGRKTALLDNPVLTARSWTGKNPLRLVIDKEMTLPKGLNLFDRSNNTIVFTSKNHETGSNLEFCKIDFQANVIFQILQELHKRKIQSLIVEGGTFTINSFLKENLWDEARVLVADKYLKTGIKAPEINDVPRSKDNFSNCVIHIYRNCKG